MRNFVLAVMVALGLAFVGISSGISSEELPEQAIPAAGEVSGQITEIKDNSLMIKDEAGKTHSYEVAESKTLDGLKIGDHVLVKLENGKITSVKKS